MTPFVDEALSAGMTDTLVGFDVGGTKIEIAILTPQSEVLWRERLPTPQGDYQGTLLAIEHLLETCLKKLNLPRPTSIGFGIPGCLDPRTQFVRGANSQVLNGKALKEDLERLLQTTVFIENDANCLTLSESVDGAAQGMPLVFGVILGTGCGGGLVFHQKIWSGANHLAGEWGHTPLPHAGLKEQHNKSCWCGKVNCMELWISGPAFEEEHQLACGQDMSPPSIVQAMRQGDLRAQQSFDLYVDRLARGLSQIVNTLDPSCIVLGGGMSNVTEIYAALSAQILNYSFTTPIRTQFLQAQHGDSSGVRGAAWLSRL
jgi:fructokinase